MVARIRVSDGKVAHVVAGRIRHLHLPRAHVQQIRRTRVDKYEWHIESSITAMEGIGISTGRFHSSRVDDTGEARVDGI